MLALSAMLTAQPNQDSILSLEECIKLSLANNLKLKQAEMEVKKSHLRLKEARASGLPQVSSFATSEKYFDIPVTMVSGEIMNMPGIMVPIKLGTNYNVSAGLQAGQMIYDASYFASLKLFGKMNEISSFNLEQSREILAYNVIQMYMFIQVIKKQIALADSNLVALRKVHSYSLQHFTTGLIRKIDLDQVTVAINNLEAEHDNMVLALSEQLTMIKYITGTDQDMIVELSDDIETITFNGQDEESTIYPIEMKILEQQKNLASLNNFLAKASRKPSVSVYAAFNYQSQIEKLRDLDNNDYWFKASYAGIRITLPIFQGNRNTHAINQRKIELEQAETGISDFQNELSAKLINERSKLTTNRNSVTKAEFNKELASNVFNVTNLQYGQGLKSLTDVLTAQSELNTANMSWLSSLLQVKLSELEISKLNGTINLIIDKKINLVEQDLN